MPSLFVSNIPYKLSKQILYELFAQIAPIVSLSYTTKIAFVEYATDAELLSAIHHLHLIKLYDKRIVLQKVEDPTKVEITAAHWCSSHYLQRIFGRFGSCKVQRASKKKRAKWICTYRKRYDAELATQMMNGKSIVCDKIFAKIMDDE